ncbi:hypothetical protein ACLBXM_09975 [Xanthobacteraceae bacterium A53D]
MNRLRQADAALYTEIAGMGEPDRLAFALDLTEEAARTADLKDARFFDVVERLRTGVAQADDAGHVSAQVEAYDTAYFDLTDDTEADQPFPPEALKAFQCARLYAALECLLRSQGTDDCAEAVYEAKAALNP